MGGETNDGEQHLSERSVLPEGWYSVFLDEADLRKAYDLLTDWPHFYGAAMQGRICTIRLETNQAWDRLESARAAFQRTPRTKKNLSCGIMLETFRLQNSVTESAASDLDDPSIELEPALPKELAQLSSDPESALELLLKSDRTLRTIFQIRKQTEGILNLHLGRPEKAREIFNELIRPLENEFAALLADVYIGMGAAQSGVGDFQAALNCFENAGLATQLTGRCLNKLQVGTLLECYYEFLGESQKSAEWRDFVAGLDCPEDTKNVYRNRRELVLQRCLAQNCLVMI